MTKYLKTFYIKDYISIIIGIIFYTIGIYGFIMPNKIVTGGLMGIVLILEYATGLKVAQTYWIANGILLLIACRSMSKQFIFRTIIGVGMMVTAMHFLGEPYIYPYFAEHRPLTDDFLSVIMGGILTGVGLGLVYSVNGSTGGVDIIGFMITKYFRISLARALLIVDFCIVISSFFILNNHTIEKTVLGIILIPVMYYTVDMVLNGARQSVQIFILSKHYDEIADHINKEVKRGCTVIEGQGWYTKNPQKIIMVIARRTEANSIFRLVDKIDPMAFITKTNVEGVYGKGFERFKQ
ncbi:MAG: YitT family protein [Capnocytophaga sp.]|nr:YitT family protein [Capnocytophaga sp.]